MTDQHPITPTRELLKQWKDDILGERDHTEIDHVLYCAWREGFRAGADQELEACCEWLLRDGWAPSINRLRAARRLKPKSLAEEALDRLDQFLTAEDQHIIHRALERLQELEGQGNARSGGD